MVCYFDVAYRKSSGWIMVYVIVIASMIVMLTGMAQVGYLTSEDQLQINQLHISNDRLSDAALQGVEAMLQSMVVEPNYILNQVGQVDLMDVNNWNIIINEDFIPQAIVNEDPLTIERNLFWWEQPLIWWETHGYKYTPPFTTGLNENVHVVIVSRGEDTTGFDISRNQIYGVNTKVAIFEIYIRAQTRENAVRRSLSIFSKRLD